MLVNLSFCWLSNVIMLFVGSETSESMECVVNIVPVVALYAGKPEMILIIKHFFVFCRF